VAEALAPTLAREPQRQIGDAPDRDGQPEVDEAVAEDTEQSGLLGHAEAGQGGPEDTFDHTAARGFIELFGLPLRTQARIQGALEDSAPLSLERKVKRR